MALAPGTTLGPYAIRAQLGSGGMGVVYTAHDPRLDRQVAIKVLPPDLTRDTTAKQRFLQEAKAASALEHPNICTIYEINETADGQLYLVMAFYEGETLKQRIERGPLAIDDAVDIATQVGQGLRTAHEAGIMHRDIKPANLIIAKAGLAKILDFGLAKLVGDPGLTKPGVVLGTHAYLSPERLRGDAVDHRTDIWSLGVVLYEMVAGVRPFHGDEPTILHAIWREQPAPLATLRPTCSTELERVVSTALEKNPEDRYPRMNELLADLTELRQRSERTTQQATTAEAVVPSIAVLPFTNMSPDPEQEYFCDGMAEEIINALAAVPAIRVSARTSSFRFRGHAADLAEIRRRLKVGAILEGSVRRAGHQLRVTAQLVNASDGYQMWSERYDRNLDDVFVVQDEIARSVVANLQVKLVGVHEPLVGRPTSNFEAHSLYLRGRYHFNKLTCEGMSKSIDCFNQAVSIERDYAQPHAGLAMAYAMLGWFRWLPIPEAMPKGKEAALEALTIDERVAEGHAALALVLYAYDWEWSKADREFRRAIDLSPGDATHRSPYALFLAYVGRVDAAIAEARRGLELDPLSLSCNDVLGYALFYARRFDEAIEQSRKTIELERSFVPAYWTLAISEEAKGQYREAVTVLEQGPAYAQRDALTEGLLGCAYGGAGDRANAGRILSELQRRQERDGGCAFLIGCVQLALGRRDEAVQWFARACEAREPFCVNFNGNPSFDPLRSDPRFQALLRRMNFPETAAGG